MKARTNLLDEQIDAWLDETQWHSSPSAIRRADSYGPVVANGVEAAKCALARMDAGNCDMRYLILLRDVFDLNPVPPEYSGLVGKMTEAWLDWARAKGHLA